MLDHTAIYKKICNLYPNKRVALVLCEEVKINVVHLPTINYTKYIVNELFRFLNIASN